MARLSMASAEANEVVASGLEQLSALVATPTIESTIVHGGARSYKFDSGVGNAATNLVTEAPSVSAPYELFYRAYIQVPAYPATSSTFLVDSGQIAGGIRMTSTGTLQLRSANGSSLGGTTIGSDSAVLNVNQWYRVELRIKVGVGSIDELEGRLDGVTFASTTGIGLSDAASTGGARVGWVNVPGASKIIYIDDVAVNDSTGAAQNSWPGDGKIVLLLPVSDSTGTSDIGADAWRAGNSGTTNLFAAVDNTPPTGATSPGTTASQIVCDTPSTTRTYDAVTETYNSKVGASDTINFVQAVAAHGESVSTGTKTGLLQTSANPVGSSVAITYGGDAGAAGAFPSTWAVSRAPASASPSVTRSTGATVRVNMAVNTRNADVCFMGVYVDYTPVQDTPELYGRPFGSHGQVQMQQLLAQ